MCGVGSFQHGSSSTKNSTAAPCQTILVPDVRQTERSRGGGGGGGRSSHIRHVPVEIRPLCVCLAQRKEEKKKKTVHGSLKIFPSSSSKLKRRMQLLAESCALSVPVKLPTLSCLLTSYFPGASAGASDVALADAAAVFVAYAPRRPSSPTERGESKDLVLCF